MSRAHLRTVHRSSKKVGARKTLHPSHVTRFWFIATIAAFPFVMTVALIAGYGSVLAFIAGAVGSLLVLLLNVILEPHPWMFDSHWRYRFEDPEFSFRLAVVAGATLLMLETSLLVFFMTDHRFEASLIRILAASLGPRG